MSIFKETFKDFVFKQLRIREAIVDRGNNPTNYQHRFGNPRIEIEGKEGKSELKIAAGAFYTNTVHKQCVIRMSSGVDITNGDILETSEKRFEKTPELLAKTYILEGGVLDDKQKQRGGKFGERKGAYGDSSIRSNAAEGFGIVPMPGIIDADIRTKTAYGSLREAKVNFVCHNRRQLEVLELLYMRPGMPVLLEWQWSPFINNKGKIDNNPYSIGDEWFDKTKKISDFNLSIIKKKEISSGNYDGFVGFCKNFEISSRPDGGYDCTTELIAAGEVLEGLKARRDGYTRGATEEEEDSLDSTTVEIDNMELILGGILELSDLNSDGYEIDKVIYYESSTSLEGKGEIEVSDGGPAKTLIELITGKGINKEENVVMNFLQQYTDDDFLWKGEQLGKKFSFWFGDITDGLKKSTKNKYHTYISWRALCNLMNKLVFPLHDPSNNEEPLTRMMYTKLNEAGEEIPLKRVPYEFNLNDVDVSGAGLIHKKQVTKLLDNSFNPSVCLFPRQNQDDKDQDNNNDIGSIMFNVKHLLDRYMTMAYSNDKLVEDFNLFDYFKKIWDDVNIACVGHHNFTLTTELERPDRARIIDLRVDPPNILPKDLFEFKIQSNKSIVRDFNYNTTIPSSLSATIAIAAQAPSSVSDLDQVTFRNFSKGIKSRFAINSKSIKNTKDRYIKKGTDLEEYNNDINKLTDKLERLKEYTKAIYNSDNNYDDDGNEILETTFSEVQNLAKSIEALIISLSSRNSKTGKKWELIPARKSAVIPLKFNCKMDGVSGIVIGHVFKVEKNKLPKGYQAEDIAFVVMGESQKITSGQDWTTEISGQLILLDIKRDTLREENNEINFELNTTKIDNTRVVNPPVFVEVDGEYVNIDDVIENPDFEPSSEERLEFFRGDGRIYVGEATNEVQEVAKQEAIYAAYDELLDRAGTSLATGGTVPEGLVQVGQGEYNFTNFTYTVKFEFK